MNDIESRLQRYREQALAEIGAYGGVEHAVEKTASMEDGTYEKTASLLDDLDAVSSFLRDGGEIEKIASYHRGGEQPMVGCSPVMENRLREPRSLGAARTKEKTRPLQRTPGGSPTAVTRTEGKDEPSKTASIEELRDQILSQFGAQARDEGMTVLPVEKTAGPKTEAISDFFRQLMYTAKKSGTDPIATLKSVANAGDVAAAAGVPTAAGHVAGATLPAATVAGLLAAGVNATAKHVAKGRKFSNVVSKGKNWMSPLESAGKAVDHAKAGRYGTAAGYATPLATYAAGGGLSTYGLAKALGGDKAGQKKEAAYDFPGGVETYSGKEGPTLSGPGTELISSNDRAIDYTKRDAKRLVVPSLRQEISEPAMSASTDPVAQRALSNASEAGVKTAGLAAGGIRGLLLGGAR